VTGSIIAMRCPSCAADIPDGRTTCPACGAVIETDPTVVFVPVPGVQNPPFTPEQAGALGGISGFALVVDRGPRAGMTYLLPEGNTTVGRHPASDIFLDDVTVSRHHCRFLAGNGDLVVEDSGSTNGTYVNGGRVDRAALAPGDQVVVGRFHLLVVHGHA